MEVFVEFAVILFIATGFGIVSRILKQPLIVGYIASGIVVGPYVLNILNTTTSIELFSKIGIAVLLFIVGISLSPQTIKETGKAALVTGIGQIIFTSVIGFFIMRLCGFSPINALYGSIALTFSSTIIVLKLISDRGDLEKLYGKISIGFLLVQDVVATLLLVVIPIVGAYLSVTGDQGATLETIGWLIGKGIIASITLYLFSKYVLPRFSHYLARSPELLFLFSATWGIVMAGLFYQLGFSIEIGALIAGVTLSASSYAKEITARMHALRDFFIVLFFVLLGSHLVISDIQLIAIPALILSLFVLIGNPLIVFLLMNTLGYRRRTGFMAGLTVAQISEFSLILMALGFTLGHVEQSTVSLITVVGIITISGSTYLFMYADKLYTALIPLLKALEIRKTAHEPLITTTPHFDTIIFGYGRVGHEFVRAAQTLGGNYVVVDYNPDAIARMKKDAIPSLFGDAEDVEFLTEINITDATRVISTVPDHDANVTLTDYYHRHRPEGTIVVIGHSIEEAQHLYRAGATYVIMPHHLGASHASELLIQQKSDVRVFEIERAIQEKQFSFEAMEARS